MHIWLHMHFVFGKMVCIGGIVGQRKQVPVLLGFPSLYHGMHIIEMTCEVTQTSCGFKHNK